MNVGKKDGFFFHPNLYEHTFCRVSEVEKAFARCALEGFEEERWLLDLDFQGLVKVVIGMKEGDE
ncbi:unnamed protein product [Dovyalis caffra]|uniref:Uncharacterized protein n=1 Tax=Dovyalis caffra TaxID=77055 RepID=A0AAV1RCD4_9ROSI|nr:unnamed protein product [Dovyalis caffra]